MPALRRHRVSLILPIVGRSNNPAASGESMFPPQRAAFDRGDACRTARDGDKTGSWF
jgi:hypothetical protein